MSDELAAMVAATMGPGEVDDLLREAMDRLRAEYAGTEHSVSITFSATTDRDGRDRREITWRVHADPERGYGVSAREAFMELREKWDQNEQVPEAAERIAAVLRTVPDVGHLRENALSHARNLLEDERVRLRDGRKV